MAALYRAGSNHRPDHFFPVLSVLVAATIANLNDCTLHEGFVNPCVIAGVDWGGALYAMGVMGWLGLVTLPFGLLILLIFALKCIVQFIRHKRKSRL